MTEPDRPPTPPRWYDSPFGFLFGIGLCIALILLGMGGCSYLLDHHR